MRADRYNEPDPRVVMCPTCGASPGEMCKTVLIGARNGPVVDMRAVHMSRRNLLDEQLRRR